MEIIERILSFADIPSVFRASAVCHQWRIAAVSHWNMACGKIWRLSVNGSDLVSMDSDAEAVDGDLDSRSSRASRESHFLRFGDSRHTNDAEYVVVTYEDV